MRRRNSFRKLKWIHLLYYRIFFDQRSDESCKRIVPCSMLNEHAICHGVRLDDRIMRFDRKTFSPVRHLIFIISNKSPFRMSCSDAKLSWDSKWLYKTPRNGYFFNNRSVYPIEFARFNKLRLRIDSLREDDDMWVVFCRYPITLTTVERRPFFFSFHMNFALNNAAILYREPFELPSSIRSRRVNLFIFKNGDVYFWLQKFISAHILYQWMFVDEIPCESRTLIVFWWWFWTCWKFETWYK